MPTATARLRRKIVEKNIPISASFELTYSCNINCNICYQFLPDRNELTTLEVKNILDQLADAGCLYLSFTGGEPLLRKDLWEIAEYAKEKTFALTLQTNGTLLGLHEADRIKKLNFFEVHISVLGADDSTHDRITRTKGSFRKAINAAELLIERGITVVFKTTVMKENFAEYKDIWKLGKELGARPYFSPVIYPKTDKNKGPLEHRLSDEDLKELADSGFTMVYVGIESGDDEVLKACNKGATQDDFALAAQKCHEAGIAWSGIFLLGLAGNDPEKSKKHAIESAKLINRMAPQKPINWYISPLTLRVTPGTELWTQKSTGEFQPCSSTEILEELYTMIEHTSDDLQKCIFNANHASNYLSLKGELGRDKQKFLKIIETGIKNPSMRRPDYLRGL